MSQKKILSSSRKEALLRLFASEFHEQTVHSIPLEEEEATLIEKTALEANQEHDFDERLVNELVDGVTSHKKELDTQIETYLKNWKLYRLDTIIICVLRVAMYELTYREPKLATPIIINEAIKLAKEYGDDTAFKLVNGVLDAYAKEGLSTKEDSSEL